MVFWTAFHKVSSHQTIDLESFADSSNIPWNPPTIVRQHHTDRKQMGLLREQCVEWKKGHLRCCCNQVRPMNDSKIILHRVCQIRRNFKCKWLLVSSSAPRTSLGSSGSPEKSLFCTCRIVPTELPNRVPVHYFCSRHLWSWWSLFWNTAHDPEPSFAMSPRSTSIFEIVGLTPNSGDDRGPSTMQSVLFCPHSLLQRSPHLCCWLSSAAMPVFSTIFPTRSPLLPVLLDF